MTRIKGQLTTADYLPIVERNRPVRELERDGEYLWETYRRLSFCAVCRTSDVRTLRWKDILGKSIMTRAEQRIKRDRLIRSNGNVQEGSRSLYEALGQPIPKQYTSPSLCTGKPYSLERINRLFEILRVGYGLSVRALPTHTFCKTLGRYVHRSMGRSAGGLIPLNRIFRHSSLETTRCYIGLTQENIDKVFDSICL